jgi:hypothetical protein
MNPKNFITPDDKKIRAKSGVVLHEFESIHQLEQFVDRVEKVGVNEPRPRWLRRRVSVLVAGKWRKDVAKAIEELKAAA